MSYNYYTNKSASDMSQARSMLYDSQKANNLYFATPSPPCPPLKGQEREMVFWLMPSHMV